MTTPTSFSEVEAQLRQELHDLYHKYQGQYTTFACQQINGLLDADPVSPDEFAAHAKGFIDQMFVETEFIYESGAFEDGCLVAWNNPENVPHKAARNYLLVALYQVFIACMESDAADESTRILTLRDSGCCC